VGTIRLTANGNSVARVRRVRIDLEWQHTSVPRLLADRVGAFCRDAGYARVEFVRGSAPSWFKTLAGRQGLANLATWS
jgi:hypothetical protein